MQDSIKATPLPLETVLVAMNTRSTPITGLILFKYLMFTLTYADLLTENGDKFDVYIDTRLPDGTYLNLIHFTQINGDDSDGSEVAVITLGATSASAVISIADQSAGAVLSTMVPIDNISVRVAVIQVATNDNESAALTVEMVGSRDYSAS